MARILNLEAYPLATTISDDSYLVGTDVTDNKETKNFKIEDLKTHILPDPLNPGIFENATVVVDVDGQISSVTQGASGSSKWSFSLNTNDIYRNSNVGIGDFSAADPAQELEVQGKVQVSGADAEFIGDINGAIRFNANAGEALSKGDVVYISEMSGTIPVVSKADASDAAKMPAFGLAFDAASLNSSVEVITFGTLSSIDTSAFSLGDTVYVSTTAGQLTNTPPTGEANLLQNIGKVQRVHASSGSIKVGGAGRTNATPNLNEGSLFIGNSSNQSSTIAIGGASTFLKSDGTTASWATISEGEVNTASNVGGESELFKQKVGSDLEFRTLGANPNISITQGSDTVSIGLTGVALVGTYTDGYVPRWNATTNTLESGTIRDDGTTVSINNVPSNTSVFKVDTNSTTHTAAIYGVHNNPTITNNFAVRGYNTNNNLSSDTYFSAGVFGHMNLGSVPANGNYAGGVFRLGDTTLDLSGANTTDASGVLITIDHNQTLENLYGINIQEAVTNVSISGSAYGLYLEGWGGAGSVAGTKYGIYQEGTGDKNYLAGQLQLKHTAGTAGQFLKAVDTVGNAEWADVTSGVQVSGTPVDNEIAVWTAADTIEGDSNFTWDARLDMTTTAQYGIDLTHNPSGTSGTIAGHNIDLTGNASTVNAYGFYSKVDTALGGNALGGHFRVLDSDGSATGSLNSVSGGSVGGISYGSRNTVVFTGTETSGSSMYGSANIVTVDTTETHGASMFGSSVDLNYNKVGGTLTNAFGFYSTGIVCNDSGSTITNAYGIYLADNAGAGTITNSYGVFQVAADDKNYFGGQLQLGYTSGTAGQFLKSVDVDGNAEWADVPSGVTASSGAAQRLAVFDGTDSVEGDANLTYTGSTLKINSNNALSPNNFSSITGNYLASQVETDDANCLLYGYGASNSGELILASARGTIADSEAVQSGDSLGEVQGFGHTGTGFRLGGRMLFLAGENYQEGTNYGTTFSLRLTPNGSTAAVTRYTIDGNGDHNFNGNVKVDGQAYSAIASTVTPSLLAATIDWDNGNMQVLDLQTGGSVNTLTINNPKAGASYFIKIIQSGGGTITWPASVKWAENDTYAGSAGAGDIDAVALTYDGTSYLANYSLDYQ